ncbi:MAG: hybrid sensor histidine kinase/response regulator, partial [Deltaproteobacteria bacterium]
GSIIVIRDITEKVHLRKEMETNQKLESIGLLAGGIAHDFNNLLTAIYGNISLAKMFPDNQEKVSHYLEKTEQSLSQAQGLTQQLLTFARGGSPVKQLVAIGPLLHEVAKFSLRGSNTDVEINIATDLWSASVDTGQFSQIINNLAMNASQAMPNGGRLTIKAENVILSPAELPVESNNDRFIKITMSDQGVGISPEHLNKIFDPYFTTKRTGSGLGLATVFSIIKNHNGLINVESKSDAGTTFTIHLPASGTTPAAATEHTTETNQMVTGKILVMDDEEVVRETCGEMLIVMGHTVDYAANGQEALDKYQQALKVQQPFDLVIMDLTIPGGIGGKEAIQLLLEIDPKAKAIVSSGYSHDDVMANFRDYGFLGVVAKPYIMDSFSRVIQEILARPAD